MKLLNHDLAGTSHDQARTFAYNPASQIVENGRSNDLFAAAPAAADIGSAVNGLNQLSRAGGALVAHDARGNLTARGGRTFGYTAENRLASVSGPSSIQLAYHPLGRLFHMDGSATDFLYDGSEIIGEKQAYGGGLRKRFVHGPGVDEPLVVYDATHFGRSRVKVSVPIVGRATPVDLAFEQVELAKQAVACRVSPRGLAQARRETELDRPAGRESKPVQRQDAGSTPAPRQSAAILPGTRYKEAGQPPGA